MKIYNNTNKQGSIEKLTTSIMVDQFVTLWNKENKTEKDIEYLNVSTQIWQSIRIEQNADIAFFESIDHILKIEQDHLTILKRWEL